MVSVQVDLGEARSFAKELGDVPLKVAREVPSIVRKGAVNIKKGMKADLFASSNGGFRFIGTTVDFDETDSGFGVEIGPTAGAGKGTGALANVAYFGTSRGGGTVPDPVTRLNEEVPRFERALGDVLEGIL